MPFAESSDIFKHEARDGYARLGALAVFKLIGWWMGRIISEFATSVDFTFDELIWHVEGEIWRQTGLHIPGFRLREILFGVRSVDNILLGTYIF